MSKMTFEFSDTIAGYVVSANPQEKTFSLKTTDGREFSVKLATSCNAQITRNLGEPYEDCTGQAFDHLVPARYLFAYGTFYPQADAHVFEAQSLYFPGRSDKEYRFEEPDWWIKQARNICDFFLKSQFNTSNPEEIDYTNYRTIVGLSGAHTNSKRQETDTISRMIYGMASTFLLTGEDIYLEAAERGTAYLRERMRFYDLDENIIYWYHGIDRNPGAPDHKVFASEFGDDYFAIPMYEQIYALAGPTQTYRINGDPSIMKDIKMTIDLFERFFLDKEKKGYFSHLDPVTLDPRSDNLDKNKGRKNWNSVGDHAPAYLINLYLATGEQKYLDMLTYCADCICEYFPDYENSPFVQERFMEDWSHDKTWGWQHNRSIIGHNLKIAWNLMRINALAPKDTYVKLARKIAETMPKYGMDQQRGGWYDSMERALKPGEEFYRFSWHDRKAWWQQEQSILAYQILYGNLGDKEYQRLGREAAAFYNAFFLDHDDGAVYFNVFANGMPYLMGTERMKGSHSMSAYHSVELAYLSTVYINLMHTKQPLDLYFKPKLGGFPEDVLRVCPDMLPPGSVKITEVWIDNNPWKNFDAEKLTVSLPNTTFRPKIKVRLVPVK
ncbi:MAG: N-acyl-D-glucosamine 2-epimerase [Candidatus Riflebacteria bacterium HGW-Riflebacteria-2]|nr:MAG: N-acyl-D-glucosamine 2-epimerase [Candidatus Riflebacteria bacterium HGW-Riflebacteria-2]